MITSQDKNSPVDSEAHNTPVKKQKVIKRQENLFVTSLGFLYFFCCVICQYIYQTFYNEVAKTDAKTSVNIKFIFCKNRWSQQKHFFFCWSIFSIITKDSHCLLQNISSKALPTIIRWCLSSDIQNIFIFKNKNKTKLSIFSILFILVLYWIFQYYSNTCIRLTWHT